MIVHFDITNTDHVLPTSYILVFLVKKLKPALFYLVAQSISPENTIVTHNYYMYYFGKYTPT